MYTTTHSKFWTRKKKTPSYVSKCRKLLLAKAYPKRSNCQHPCFGDEGDKTSPYREWPLQHCPVGCLRTCTCWPWMFGKFVQDLIWVNRRSPCVGFSHQFACHEWNESAPNMFHNCIMSILTSNETWPKGSHGNRSIVTGSDITDTQSIAKPWWMLARFQVYTFQHAHLVV